jgi:hypothetical protein
MDKSTCSIDGCERNDRMKRGWCDMHWQRWRKNGDPLRLARAERFAAQPTTCSVEGCDEPRKSRGWCKAHYLRWFRRGGDVATRIYRERQQIVGYQAVHARLRRDRGLASAFICEHCENQALQWAYDHDDPEESSQFIAGRSLTYSLDSQHYIPLCAACHKTFDLYHAQVGVADESNSDSRHH